MPAVGDKPGDELSEVDRQLEKRIRDVGHILARNAEPVDRETLIFLLGALLNQRDRFGQLMRAAAHELDDIGCDKAELIVLLKAYGNIRELQ